MAQRRPRAFRDAYRAESGPFRRGRASQTQQRFSNEAALAKLAVNWPAGRLVEVWNSLPGETQVKKFKDRATAVSRIWKAIQNLAEISPIAEEPAPPPEEALVVELSETALPEAVVAESPEPAVTEPVAPQSPDVARKQLPRRRRPPARRKRPNPPRRPVRPGKAARIAMFARTRSAGGDDKSSIRI